MRIVCDIPIDEDGPRAAKELLDCLARIWARRMRRVPFPKLYSAGIRYRIEPNAGTFEQWKSPVQTFESGWGDCDDLTIYRVAELLAVGEGAESQVVSQTTPIGIRMHARVARGNGAEEDPSIILGAEANG